MVRHFMAMGIMGASIVGGSAIAAFVSEQTGVAIVVIGVTGSLLMTVVNLTQRAKINQQPVNDLRF